MLLKRDLQMPPLPVFTSFLRKHSLLRTSESVGTPSAFKIPARFGCGAASFMTNKAT